VVEGQLYTYKQEPITHSPAFSLACVSDALAKRTIHGLYTPGQDDKNLSALHMLTARYCGTSYTVPGIEFQWVDQVEPMGKRKTESAWGTGLALCISTPRLMTLTDGGGALIDPAKLPPSLRPSTCATMNCTTAHGWADALRAECKTKQCPSNPITVPGTEFASYIPPSPTRNHLLVRKK
jgi:hypothetical protein